MRTINNNAENGFDINDAEFLRVKGYVTFGPEVGELWWTWCPYTLRKKIQPIFEEYFEAHCDYFGGWKIEIESCGWYWYECLFSDIEFWRPYFAGEKRLTQKVLKAEAARADDEFHDKIVAMDDALEAEIQEFCNENGVKPFEWELFEHYIEKWHFVSSSLQIFISQYWERFRAACRDRLLEVAETNSCVDEFLAWEKEVQAEKEEQERKEQEKAEQEEKAAQTFTRLYYLLSEYRQGKVTSTELEQQLDEMILGDNGGGFQFKAALQAVKWGLVSPPPVVSFANE